MDIIDKVLDRRHSMILKRYKHRQPPHNLKLSDIPVVVDRDEFHAMCSIDPSIYDTLTVAGLNILIKK